MSSQLSVTALRGGFEAQFLSDSDLLSTILGTKITLRDGNQNATLKDLADANYSEPLCLADIVAGDSTDFMSHYGIGKRNAVKLACLGELSRRLWRVSMSRGDLIDCAQRAADYCRQELRFADQEHAIVLFLNTRNRLIRSVEIGVGSSDACTLSSRDIIRTALKYKASSMILIHNHPSGEVDPSSEDIAFSRTLKNAGKLMDLHLNDSIIIGNNDYFSLFEKGLL